MKNILHYVLIAVIIFLIGVIIYQHNIIKDNQSIEIEEQKCISDTSSITKMSNCVEASIPKWDKEIQDKIKKLKKYLTNEEYIQLLQNQEKWEEYRKSQTKLIYDTYLNSHALIYLNYASIDATNIISERAGYLSWFLEIMKDREKTFYFKTN